MSSLPTPVNGSVGAGIAYDLPEWMAIAAFMAIAWYNTLELNVSIFLTFRRREGIYFWSLLISSWGVFLHSVGFLLKFFQLTTNNYVSCVIITIGWYAMVTGQALVLYSRLHLVVRERRILRGVLYMIIWNAITLHIPTTVFTFGSSSDLWPQFDPGFQVMERLQMTVFFLQEVIISGLYLWATVRFLKPVYRSRTRSVMMKLICINVIIVLMDIALLSMEFVGHYEIEASLKSMVYSIKLKLEFSVLNQLMHVANSRNVYVPNGASEPDEKADNQISPDDMMDGMRRKASTTPLSFISRVIPRLGRSPNEKSTGVRPKSKGHGITANITRQPSAQADRSSSIIDLPSVE